jgi:anti-sigma factor RsiW
MSCDKFRPLVEEYAVDALDDSTHAEMRQHLDGCEECRGEMRQVLRLTALLAQSGARAPRTAPMSARRLAAVAAAMLIVSGLVFISRAEIQPPPHRPQPRRELVIEAPRTLYPESRASVRVVSLATTGLMQIAPVVRARVSVLLERAGHFIELFHGLSSAGGSLDCSFDVPALDEGDYRLVVRSDGLERSETVKVRRDSKLMLVTDKPFYQPNQQVLIRAMALDATTLKPLGESEIVLEILDSKGNKVYKKRASTSRHGIASGEFQLADEVNFGTYRVLGSLGKISGQKTFEVKKYVLPKFKIEISTDRSAYRPKEKVKGSVLARYFYGKPVAESGVSIRARAFDVSTRTLADLKLKTDREGRAEFEFELPEMLAGQPLEKGDAQVEIDAIVTDPAERQEEAQTRIVVSAEPVRFTVVPESGTIVPDLENRIFVVVSAPDGSPLKTSVSCGLQTVETDEAGFASFTVLAERRKIKVKEGRHVLEVSFKAGEFSKTLDLECDKPSENLLLKVDKAIYKAGDTIRFEAHANSPRATIFLDVVRQGQTYLTATLERPEFEWDIPGDLFGPLELHAYRILPSGEIVRDSRLVYVEPSADYTIRVTPDQPEYRPGGEAKIRFEVAGADGRGVPSALGVIIVDEAVYAISEMRPGLEKVYFALQEELLKPRYQIKDGPGLTEVLREADRRRQGVAGMLLANAQLSSPRWSVNTVPETYKEHAAHAARTLEKIGAFIVYHLTLRKHGEYLTGDRRLRPDLVEVCRKNKVLKPDEAVDLWGVPYTTARLREVDPYFSAESVCAAHSTVLDQVFPALEQHVLDHTVVQRVGEGWRYRFDPLPRLLPPENLVDVWGARLTIDRLQALSTAFHAQNVAALTDDLRRAWIHQALVEKARFVNGEFAPDTLMNLGRPEAVVDPATGREYDLRELEKSDPAFLPASIIAVRDAALIDSIYRKLLEEAESVLESPAAFRAGALDRVLGTSASGEPLTLRTLSKIERFAPPQLSAHALQVRFQKVYRATLEWCRKQSLMRRNVALPPDDVVERMLKDGALADKDLVDLFGRRIEWIVDRARSIGRNGCGCEMVHFHLFSTGPDGKKGTADDIESQYHYSPQPLPRPPGLRRRSDVRRWPDLPTATRTYLDRGLVQDVAALKELLGDLVASQETLGRQLEALGAGGGGGGRYGGRLGGKRLLVAKGGGGMADYQEIGRTREWFPETLYWNPEIITDDRGRAEIRVPLADSITTWRVTAMANSLFGHVGSTAAGVRVFQDFFVDIDFPVFLTQNDTVKVPVSVSNYLKEKQRVRLVLQREPWFELLDEETREMEVGAEEVTAAHFKVRVKEPGKHALLVKGYGTKMSDAVRRVVEVVPDGKRFDEVMNGALSGEASHRFEIPARAIDGGTRLFFKLYPSTFSQVLDGLDGMLKMPYG